MNLYYFRWIMLIFLTIMMNVNFDRMSGQSQNTDYSLIDNIEYDKEKIGF